MMIDGYVAEILNNQIMNEINAKKATDKEKLIEKDIKSIENRVRHAFNQGYEAGLKHGREQEPKTDIWSIKDVADTLAEHGLMTEQKLNALDKIKWLIEQYESEIEKCAEDRRNMPMSPTQAYLTAKIGVYGKVVADLKELIGSEGDDE